ncbi:hypothetical protein F5Y15DRAFT_406780 [Xylariaceae sp. FL0016]|nr:hypothetical protein F5Y15DRAFT_406780 [Xylariaceae sp. FL0016]
MAFDGSSTYSATLSPTASESFGFGAQVLSSSISSLASSTSSARHSPNAISKAYRQASQLFLTRRLPEALSTVLPLITPQTEGSDVNGLTEPAPIVRASRSTRIKVWSLYLTILNAILELDSDEGKDAFGSQEWRALCNKVRDGDVWEEVVQFGYHGVEGDVDSDVVINLATLLLAHARSQSLNQKRLENYLATSNTPNLDISQRLEAARSPRLPPRSRRSTSKGGASGADTPRDLNARVKILELYTLHVLLRNNEWDYAREFISVSSVLDEERRDAFLQALQSLQEEQQEAERRDREEKQRQDDQLRRDLDEARQLRAENEARERRRLEEERARREGSEVDYGIEKTPSTPGPSKPRQTGSSSSALSRPAKSSKSKGKTVAPSTLGARAAMILANIRNIIEQAGASFNSNPMLLMRFLAFIVSIVVMFSNRNIRERIQRIMGSGWAKVKQTAGMGVKRRVTYVCARTTQINDLGAAVAVFLEAGALKAIEGVRDALAATDDALVLVVAEGAFIADADEGSWAYVGVANRALAVALRLNRVLPACDTAFPLRCRLEVFSPCLSSQSDSSNGQDPEAVAQMPDPLPEHSKEHDVGIAQKRKASTSPAPDTNAQSPKRTKLEDEPPKDQPTRKASSTDRREGALQEEKRRGKRLFGGLLSTLSQTANSSQQKRRQEIERRQQARVTQQNAEDDKARQEKLAKVTARRKVEQLDFEEQVMKTRHSNMLAMAHHLQTKSRPKIYYLPWELTRDQEDIIRDQVQDTEDLVDKEVLEFGQRKQQKMKALGISEHSVKVKEEPREIVASALSSNPHFNMVPDALKPNDPRVEHKFTTAGGHKYHYMLAKPEGKPTDTVLLLHGFPDLGIAWRYQVPFLLSMDLQVIVPDMLGYGQTDAPESHTEYTMKKMAGHMQQIVKEVTDQPIILGGHDWGAGLAWRVANYYPELLKGIFNICVPYMPPNPVVVTLEQMVEKLPNFKYQLQLASGEAEKIIDASTARLRGFHNTARDGRTPDGQLAFTIVQGVIEDRLESVGPSPLHPPEIADFYVKEYSRNGMRGPCNWYKTRELNGQDDVALYQKGQAGENALPMPAMLIMADKDAALPLWLADGQEKYFAAGLKKAVVEDCAHWVMVQRPEQCNKYIGEFVKSVQDGSFKAHL